MILKCREDGNIKKKNWTDINIVFSIRKPAAIIYPIIYIKMHAELT